MFSTVLSFVLGYLDFMVILKKLPECPHITTTVHVNNNEMSGCKMYYSSWFEYIQSTFIIVVLLICMRSVFLKTTICLHHFFPILTMLIFVRHCRPHNSLSYYPLSCIVLIYVSLLCIKYE